MRRAKAEGAHLSAIRHDAASGTSTSEGRSSLGFMMLRTMSSALLLFRFMILWFMRCCTSSNAPCTVLPTIARVKSLLQRPHAPPHVRHTHAEPRTKLAAAHLASWAYVRAGIPSEMISFPMDSVQSKSWCTTTTPSAVTCTSNSMKSEWFTAAFWKLSIVFSRTERVEPSRPMLAPAPRCLQTKSPDCSLHSHLRESTLGAAVIHTPNLQPFSFALASCV